MATKKKVRFGGRGEESNQLVVVEKKKVRVTSAIQPNTAHTSAVAEV
jgi:hypothetical protein